MKEKLYIGYDEEGDLFELRIGKPTPGYMKNLGNDIFERIDEKTGKSTGIIILNFKKHTSHMKSIDIPFPFKIEAAP